MTNQDDRLTREQAERVADALTAAGIPGAYHEGAEEVAAATLAPETLPPRWALDADGELWRREMRSRTEAIADDAVRSYVRARQEAGDPGITVPCTTDLGSLAPLAARPQYRRHGPPQYRPDPTCPLRLRLREATLYAYRQDAYADVICYAVPVAGPPPADLAPCRRNLDRFAASIRTHTGWAGSGATWSAWLEETPHGLVAVLECRASLCY